MFFPGAPIHALFPGMPKRLAEMAAAAGAYVAQPDAARHARRKGFCQGDQEGRLFNPAIRYVHGRMELIHREEELWAERILVERRDQDSRMLSSF